MIKSVGTLYVGHRWIKLECDHELGKYLRKLYRQASYGCDVLQRPSHEEHITVVSEYESYDYDDAYKFHGQRFEFFVDIQPFHNGNAWWYPVYSIQLNRFRSRLMLPRRSEIPLHFCIGYQREGKNYVAN